LCGVRADQTVEFIEGLSEDFNALRRADYLPNVLVVFRERLLAERIAEVPRLVEPIAPIASLFVVGVQTDTRVMHGEFAGVAIVEIGSVLTPANGVYTQSEERLGGFDQERSTRLLSLLAQLLLGCPEFVQ